MFKVNDKNTRTTLMTFNTVIKLFDASQKCENKNLGLFFLFFRDRVEKG